MKLVDDWKQALQWWSVRWALVGTLLSAMGIALATAGSAAQWSSVLPPWLVYLLALAIFLCVLIGRLMHQDDKKPDETDQAGV